MTLSHLPHIVTASGRVVTAAEGVPTLDDIAQGLERAPRFAGHTRREWSVLEHSLYVMRLAAQYAGSQGYDRQQRHGLGLAALLHDAHEAVTGDVPTPFKSPALRSLQDSLDRRIMDAYFPGGHVAYLAFTVIVKGLDYRALLAEAWAVGPAAFKSESGMTTHFGDVPDLPAVLLLRQTLKGESRPVAADFRRCYECLTSRDLTCDFMETAAA